jgi:hypothetical protein
MKKPDKLFVLVKSLNKNEKGYFKKHTNKEKKYLKVFDEISRHDAYDEKKIIKKFDNEAFSRQFHVIKNYLFHNILKHLHDYHYNSSHNSTLKNILQSVEILYKKGLYDICSQLLTKAKKTAIDYEDETDLSLLEIIEWQKKILFRQVKDLDKTEKTLISLKKEEELALNKYQNSREYRFFVDKILLVHFRTETVKSEESLKVIDQLTKHPLLRSEKKAVSLRAKLWYNSFYEIYFYLKKDVLSSAKFAERKLELMEKYPGIIKNQPFSYIDILNNLGIMYYEKKKYNQVFGILNKLKAIPAKTIDVEIKKFTVSVLMEITAFNSMGEFSKAMKLIESTKTQLDDYSGKIDMANLLDFYREIAYTGFASGDYKMSLLWINKILNMENKGEREDIINSVKLLSLILNYEKKNEALLESEIKSALRAFENKKSHYIEILFIKSLEKLIREKDDKNSTIVMKDLKEKITKVFKRGFYAISKYDYELITSWLRSKIENKPFAAIVKNING